jgi:pyruvate/2-oxoglutarate dehydrogenase complex dihydrolipoamide acyltransferase (E2) component
MALDVFHQVLTRLHELAGGNPRQAVSFVDVLKQEKLFGAAEMILSKLQAEGWVADASKRDHVYVTTWGIDEVRRVSVSAPAPVPAAVVPAPAAAVAPPAAAKPAEPKNAGALREAAAKARELATTLEELAAGAGGTGAQRKAKAKKALATVTASVEEAFE